MSAVDACVEVSEVVSTSRPVRSRSSWSDRCKELFAPVIIASTARGGIDHDMAAAVMPDLAGGTVPAGWHPHRRGLCGLLEHCGDIGVAVRACREDMIEPCGDDLGEVGFRDQATIGDERDLADTEALLQIGHHCRQGGGVVGVAGEHVMRDRDPVAGDQQADHHLRSVRTVTQSPWAGRQHLPGLAAIGLRGQPPRAGSG